MQGGFAPYQGAFVLQSHEREAKAIVPNGLEDVPNEEDERESSILQAKNEDVTKPYKPRVEDPQRKYCMR